MKGVKASYSAIVNALNNIYEQTHEPESLGISRALCKSSTVVAMYLLDYALPQVVKLSRALQAERIDLTAIIPLVDATLNTLDDVTLPAAKWVLELMDPKDEIRAAGFPCLGTGGGIAPPHQYISTNRYRTFEQDELHHVSTRFFRHAASQELFYVSIPIVLAQTVLQANARNSNSPQYI